MCDKRLNCVRIKVPTILLYSVSKVAMTSGWIVMKDVHHLLLDSVMLQLLVTHQRFGAA